MCMCFKPLIKMSVEQGMKALNTILWAIPLKKTGSNQNSPKALLNQAY